MPDAVTFAFAEKDTREEKAQADVAAVRESTRNSMIQNGTIDTTIARNMAVDSGDLKKEFVPQDVTPEQSVDDEERTDEATEDADPVTPALTSAPLPPPVETTPVAKERLDYAAIKQQLLSIKEALTA